jgi:LysM repeat protein
LRKYPSARVFEGKDNNLTDTIQIGISAPGPTQSGIISSCNNYLMANPGGSCSAFATRAGISLANLYSWNPVLGANGANCSTSFWGNEYYCVGISSTASVAAPTSTKTTVTAPGATQSGIVANCNKYLMANAGGTCTAFASRAGITTAQLYSWNPVLGSSGQNCASSFWGDEYYCVGVGS